MTTNHEELAGRFADRLLALAPTSVLDVGCGAGFVLARCRAAGVLGVGIERQAERLCEGTDGAVRVRADASRLPFGSESFDWVTLRHVPHHLEDPRTASAEAWRVARVGVMVAEPWFDPNVPSQVHGRDADRWLKRQDRRRGMHHGENHTAAELLALLPSTPARATIETFTALRARTEASLAELGDRALAGNDPGPEEREEWARWIDLARRGELTQNGTLILCAWKREG